MNTADDNIELVPVCKEQSSPPKLDPPSSEDTAIQIEERRGLQQCAARNSIEAENGEPHRAPMSIEKRVVADGGRAEVADREKTRDLYWYIWEGDEDNVKQLLEKKDRQLDVKKRDSHGYAPVHYAAKFNRPEIMKMLVAQGHADIKAKTVSEEYTALHLAACYLRHACKPSSAGKSAKPSAEVTDQLDGAKGPLGGRRHFKRTQSKTDTLQPPRYASRRGGPHIERQTSCKDLFQFLVNKEEIDINAKDRYGFTPLHIACQSGNEEAVELLLERDDINLTIQDGNGDTPLHEACFHGHQAIVEILLEKIEKKETTDTHEAEEVKAVCTQNNAGQTPFHIACREDHYEIVELLLGKHLPLLEMNDKDNATPLHYACRNDNVQMIQLFLDKRSKYLFRFLTPRASDGVTPMHIASQYGCIKVMAMVLSKFDEQATDKGEVVDVQDTYNQTPLHYATEYGKTDMMSLLLERGADTEAKDVHSYTPLLTAAEFGQTKGFQLLLDKNASPTVQNNNRRTALFLAAEHNRPLIIESILKKSSRRVARLLHKTTDTSFNTCLHIAAQNGHLDSVRMLWKYRDQLRLQLQAKNVLLKTAMHLAAENGHNHIVVELQHYWSNNVNDTNHEATDMGHLLKNVDDDGNSPLHLACKHGFVDVAKTLIKMPGADIAARNKVLWTPLDCAAANGHSRVIKELVSAKADIDPTDKLKITPLHLAAKKGHVTAVQTLIKYGANVGLRDQRGFNALDWAIEKGHKDVAEVIVTGSEWKLALRNCTTAQDGTETTPFRKLIQRMPDVAQLVLKKCTRTNAKDEATDLSPDSTCYAVTFSYEFVEDFEASKEWKGNKLEADKDKPVKKRALKHPMKIMVESRRTELLKHPLIYSLIDHKWKYEMVAFFFYITLVFYLLFAVVLTAFALNLPHPLSPSCYVILNQKSPVNVFQLPSPAQEVLMNFLINRSISVNNDGVASNITREGLCTDVGSSTELLAVNVGNLICGLQCPATQQWSLVALSVVIILFCLYKSIRVLHKTFRFLSHQFKWHHLGSLIDDINISTMVKFPLLACTAVFVLAFIPAILRNKCLCPFEWQWQVGIAAVFLAWTNLVLHMRKWRLLDIGLYVLMFQSILKTFFRVMPLIVVLVAMFALAFHMTFNLFHPLFVRSPFTNMLDSTWKTMTMTVGEMGYENIFHLSSGGSDENIPPIPFPGISYALWVIFLILMPILFTNLLVGLAVDDIKGIQEAATLTRLKMRVDLILALDGTKSFQHVKSAIRKLPFGKFSGIANSRNLREHGELTIHPNKLHLYSFVPKFLIGESFNSAEHLSLELTPIKTPADQVNQNLMLEMSKIQEMLLSMNERLQEVTTQKEMLREVTKRVCELSEEKDKRRKTWS